MNDMSASLVPYFPKPLSWQKTNGLVVITGGLGFIGSCLANFFMLAGQDILIVDDVSEKKLKNITTPTPPDAPHYLLSATPAKNLTMPPIISPDEFTALTRGHYNNKNIIALFHMGAVSDTQSRDEDLVLSKNTDFSEDAWHKSVAWQIPFIYASYGDGTAGLDEPALLSDLQKLHPLNLYRRSKHLFDLMVMAEKEKQTAATSTPPFFAGLKFFNVFGPNEYHKGKESSIIPRFYNQACQNGKMQLWASTDPTIDDGDQVRDFIWVMDCVWAMVSLLNLYHGQKSSKQTDKDFLKKSSGIFNVGGGRATSFNQLASFVLRHLPPTAAHTTVDYISTPDDFVEDYQNHPCANIAGLKNLIDFTPTDIDTAVGFYIKDFLEA